MDQLELESKINDLKKHIESENQKAIKSVEESLNGRVDKEIKESLKKNMETLQELEKKHGDRLDDFEIELKKGLEKGEKAGKSFAEMLGDKLGEEKIMNSIKAENATTIEFDELTGKAVGTITPQDNFTGEIPGAEYRPGIVERMQRSNHIRDLLGAGSTNSSIWRYVEQTTSEGAFNNPAPGGAKGQIDYDFAAKDAPVRKIAGYARVAEEVLDDVSGMTEFLSRQLAKDLRLREDNQFLYGAGTGQNLTGLTINAATFAATTGDTNATIIDLLIQVISQLEASEYNPNGITLHPSNWWTIFLAKDAEGAYLMQSMVTRENGQLRIGGVPVFKTTAVAAGEYICGDWVNGAEIRDRMGLNVRFFDQDADNVTTNLVTIRAEERLAFPIYYPQSFMSGNIATDIAKIVAKT